MTIQWKTARILAGMAALLAGLSVFALGPLGGKSMCELNLCFSNPADKKAHEKKYGCTFKDCHLANGEDIFRWAIGKKETGAPPYYYDTPDENPCNAGNNYCAALTGNPASAGRTEFYAASYGTQQITLGKFFEWLNPKGKTKFAPAPECIQNWFLDDKALMDSLKDAGKRLAWGKGLVSGRKAPAATVDKDGKIAYPAVPADIKKKAIELKILIEGNAKSEADWKEMWERMAAWERVRQIVEAKWKETGGDKAAAWSELEKLGKPLSKGGKAPVTFEEKSYLALLTRLYMTNDGSYKKGIKPYVTGLHGKTPIWAEAATTFGNYALFTGAPPNLYTRLMAFFANNDCHIAAVKQMFELPKHGYDGKHADPKDAETEKWVKKAAKVWNGSSGYADLVWPIYKSYYAKDFGKTEVCN